MRLVLALTAVYSVRCVDDVPTVDTRRYARYEYVVDTARHLPEIMLGMDSARTPCTIHT
jgi:hypothetical protein